MTEVTPTDTGTTHAWRNARVLTMADGSGGSSVIERGAVVVSDGRIVFVGDETGIPAALVESLVTVINCDGRLITPGLIDCHTHLVWAGNRAREFELRLAGASYEEIARQGGGIVSSVASLRAASEADVLRETLPRLDALMTEGVTTVEVKSGYGLRLEDERKSLRVARELAGMRSVSVRTTFLGAHALPPEANGDKDAYIDLVADEMLPALAADGLIDAVDAFAEGIAFSGEQVSRVFRKARALGLPVKLHADQLSDTDGAALAASFDALSADHLEYTSETGAQAMAAAGTVAVVLPGAFYFIRETQKPPVEAFRRHGVAMAVATDANPGTSPLTSPLLAMNMAATLFGLTVDECLAGMTRNAAKALGLSDETGTLEVGKWADMAIWDVTEPAELVYRMGARPLYRRIWRGR